MGNELEPIDWRNVKEFFSFEHGGHKFSFLHIWTKSSIRVLHNILHPFVVCRAVVKFGVQYWITRQKTPHSQTIEKTVSEIWFVKGNISEFCSVLPVATLNKF